MDEGGGGEQKKGLRKLDTSTRIALLVLIGGTLSAAIWYFVDVETIIKREEIERPLIQKWLNDRENRFLQLYDRVERLENIQLQRGEKK